MAQAIDLLDDIVRDELPRMLVEIEPTIAPVFDKIKRTSIGVKSQDGLGQGWKVNVIYATGMAGSFESGDPLGPAMSSMSTGQAQLLALGSAASNLAIFPEATEVPHTGEVKRTLNLHMVVGNYSVPAAWKQLDMLNAAQLKKVNRDLISVAKNKTLYQATSFFSHEVTNNSGYVNQVLGKISAIADHGTYTNYLNITIDEQYGRIANFAKGQRIDIVDNDGGVLMDGALTNGTEVKNYDDSTNYVMLVVVDVDYLGKRIVVRPINTSSGGIPTFASGYADTTCGAAGDWIVAANSTKSSTLSRPQYSWGLNNWIKGSGTILGGVAGTSGLDLDLYSMFKSQEKAINASLTDDIINGYIGGYLDAYPGETLDTIITTQGVQQQWLKQPSLSNNRQNYERTGKALSFRGGWSQISYEFGGRVFEWIMSPMCLSKTLYGMKFGGDNVKRYGPPRIGGSEGKMGPELEFLATLGGHSGVFMVSHSSTGRPQALLEAPFWYYDLICPTDPRGLKFTGLTEATLI